MNRQQILTYIVLPGVVILGAVGYHQYEKQKELKKQMNEKTEGFVTVSTVAVQNKTFRASIPFTGNLLAVNRAELKAEVPGRVTRVLVHEGDTVSSGTVLSTQDEEDLLLAVQAAEAQLAQAQAQAQQARRDNERAQMLLEKRSITKQAAQQAETFLNATQAGVRAAESNLGLAKSRLHKSQIRSPFAGQVAQRLTQPGEMLSPGQPAFVVVDNRKLEILADLSTEAAAEVKVGMKAQFKVQGLPLAEPVKGAVTQVSPALTADGRTLRVRIEVPNVDGALKSGFFAEGEILAETTTEKPALPSNLLTMQGRDAEIFVVEGSGETACARRKKIHVGTDQNGWRPVEDLATGTPLAPGTQVISQGRDQVQDGVKLRMAASPSAMAR